MNIAKTENGKEVDQQMGDFAHKIFQELMSVILHTKICVSA